MLQGMRLMRLMPLTVIAACFCWSSPLGGLKFIPIYEALTIKAQKNSPPHIAFEELLNAEKTNSEWSHFNNIKSANLAAQKVQTPLYTKRIELPEMVLTKTTERIDFNESSGPQEVAYNGSSWIDELPRSQVLRLQEAQRRSEVLTEKWESPSWIDVAKEKLEKSGVMEESSTSPGVFVAASDNKGHQITQRSRPQVHYNNNQGEPANDSEDTGYSISRKEDRLDALGARTIVGPLEVTGGLALTNEHHFEIRRSDEGILKELGRVDLKKGLYNIDVEDTTGMIVARLVNKDGKTLGEGSFRLNRISATDKRQLQGPKIRIEPHPDFAGIVASAYNSKANDVAPPQTRVTFLKGNSDILVKKDGYAAMDNVTKGSTTVMRAAAPKHLQTASIVISGKEFKSQIYPEPMIKALQDIVSQQRAQSFEGSPSVIWGRVSLDGKDLSGIEVSVESDETLEPIYFDQFMIPDPKLKATSENGLFAFVNVSPGFHSLLATRSKAIFGYQNVVVEEGSVAQGDIDSTIKTESVPLKVYDAFSGEAVPSTVTMQSLSEDLSLESGSALLTLPHISRLGMMRVQPEGADYVSARYVYNDTDSFIHAPLVHWSWLNSIKSYLRIDDPASAGIVVGFVPDEDFEVYLAAYDNFEPRHIVYFDMQGRILQGRKGIAGGGFILYNVPEDTHEVVVLGSRTQKIYSRVIPVDANSLTVLTYRE